jgi:DtxR family Mn-dependent transcriptional regulator
VHDVAEQLEHIKSPKLINQLDAFLGFPTHDPHGDPIPDKDGNVNTVDKILLSTFNKDESGVCVGVNDSSSEFLRFLDKKKITLGKKITVLEKEDFDDSLSIEIDGEKLSISKKIANNLYIKK